MMIGKCFKRKRTCPICGLKYKEAPALSRSDNTTFICPDCGAREAMASIGIPEVEREHIIKVMRGYHD